MKKQAQLAINLAALEVKRNDSIENQAALIQANADLKQSRQRLQENGGGRDKQSRTFKRANALILTGIESEKERQKIQREFEAEQEINPLVKLQNKNLRLS